MQAQRGGRRHRHRRPRAGLNVTSTNGIRPGMQALRAEAGTGREAFGLHATRVTQSRAPA